MYKKFISLILSAVLLLGFSTNTFAVREPEIQPYYAYTQSYKTTLSISGGKAYCMAKLTGVSGTTTKVKITMTLEKKVLFWWSEKETWTQTFNSYNGTLSKTYIDTGSGTYRVNAEYIVYCGAKSETITDTSLAVKA